MAQILSRIYVPMQYSNTYVYDEMLICMYVSIIILTCVWLSVYVRIRKEIGQ